MAINLGDAILKFFGDTTNLDAAYVKVNEGSKKAVVPAQQDVDKLNLRVKELEKELERLSLKFQETGGRVHKTNEKAKDSVDLLGDSVGVRLPRELKKVIGGAQTLGPILAKAFAVTAAIAFIGIAVEAGEKLSQFISETFIFTKSMQESDKAIAEGNKKLVELAANLKEAREQYRLTGLEGAKKLHEELVILNEDLEKQKKHFEEVRTRINQLNQSEEQLVLQRIASEGFFSRLKDKTLEFFGAESSAREKVRLEIQQTQQAYIELFQAIKVADQEVSTKKKEIGNNEREFQREMKLQAFKDTQEFLDLWRQYEKALEDDFMRATAKIRNEGPTLLDPDSIAREADGVVNLADKLLMVKDAFATLGVEGVAPLAEKVLEQQTAVETLERAEQEGLATTHDVTLAKLTLIDTEIKLAQARGQSTAALEKEARQLRRQLPELHQYGRVAQQALNAAAGAMMSAAFAFGQGAISIGQAMRQIAAAIINSIAQEAMAQGTKQLALGFAALSPLSGDTPGPHFASAAIWFGLGAGLSAAAGAVAGSGSNQNVGSVGTGGTFGANQAAAQPQNTVAVRNTPRLAEGGVVTGPTLAVVGDNKSRREAVVPLDDEIDGLPGILQRLVGGRGDTHIYQIKGDVVDHKQLMRRMSRQVKRGTARLDANRSSRVLRRA